MLENPRSPRVRSVAKLSKKSSREATGLFLLEGPQAVAEALRYRPHSVIDLYATPTALERYSDISQVAVEAGVDVEFATEEVIAQLADTVTPQGFVAVARQFPVALKDVFENSPRLIAILEEVRDPGNLGTIIRVADAAGADAVVLTGRSVDLYNPKVVRATTGSIFHIPVAVGQDLGETLGRARAAGMTSIAADVKGRSLLEARSELNAPVAWVFGNEARGLSDESLAAVDDVLCVPIFGVAESMNLATAASVCLYESAFASRSGG